MSDDQKDKISGEKNTNVTEGPVETIRSEMVDMARRFMMIPKVRQTPLMQQRQFLLRKGLREDEINEAVKELWLQQDARHISNMAMQHTDTLDSSLDFSTKPSVIYTLLRMTKYAMIITGFTYASWNLLRSYILPRLLDIPEPVEARVRVVEQKVDEMHGMMQDVTTELLLKLQTVIDRQNAMDRISYQNRIYASQLNEIEKGVENINAMLVNKEPQIRILSRKRNAINSGVFVAQRSEEANASSVEDDVVSKSAEVAPVSVPTSANSPQAEKNDSGCDP
ncbi:Peroxisomal membrane protein [Dirofilaria immitis]